MSETIDSRTVREQTIALVEFEDGTTTMFESQFEDSQGGRGYDGGHWGPFPAFREDVEAKIRGAQDLWNKPSATVRYTRVTRTVEEITRVTETRAFYSERTVAVVGGHPDA